MNSYLLLRNNKESGPYSAEQLIKTGLKPYDLVWLEGRSTAWRYPSEVDELKAYAPVVEEQPFDRFYKKNIVNQPPSIEKQSALSETDQAITIKKEKPRFRVAAAWNKIDTIPQSVDVENKPAVAATITPSWKEVYKEWKTDEPAANTPAAAPKKEPVQLETKYSQSLDEIKERYAETVLKPKTRQGVSLSVNAKQFGEVGMIILVIAFGLWMVFKPDTKESNALAKTTQVKQQPKPAITEEQLAEDVAGNDDNVNNSAAQQEEKPLQSDNVQKQESNSPVYVTVDKKPNTVKPQVKKQAATIPVRFASNNLPAQKNQKLNISTQPVTGARSAVKKNTGNSVQSPQNTDGTLSNNANERQVAASTPITPAVKNIPAKKTVDELVKVEQVSKYPGVVQDVKLNVQNMTGSVLDLVVVDLKYYDKKGFYKKGETLYIKNLPANRDVIIKAPDDLGASNVTYKVGLVSSAQTGMSMVAD